MRSKRAALIVGGLVFGSLLLLLLVQLVLAADDPPPQPFQQFQGNVTSGGVPAADNLEIRVKVQEGSGFVALDLHSTTQASQGNLTVNGT